MVTRTQVTACAKRFQAVPEYRRDRDRLEHEIVIAAPHGYVWRASAVHELVMCGADGTSWVDLYADAIERMEHGIEKCTEAECDICHPRETERTPTDVEWKAAEARAERRRRCSYCGEPGHVTKTCSKYLRKHLGQ